MSVQWQETASYDAHLLRLPRSNRFAGGNSVSTVNEVWRKVLLVDDDPSIRDLVAEELRYRGYWVMVARNGSEALECLDLITPDVIVLDLMMPVMDGWTFVEQHRAHAGGGSVPIIAVSAEGDLAPRCEALGVTAFLHKPFDLDELDSCVARLTPAREASVAHLHATGVALSTDRRREAAAR